MYVGNWNAVAIPEPSLIGTSYTVVYPDGYDPSVIATDCGPQTTVHVILLEYTLDTVFKSADGEKSLLEA